MHHEYFTIIQNWWTHLQQLTSIQVRFCFKSQIEHQLTDLLWICLITVNNWTQMEKQLPLCSQPTPNQFNAFLKNPLFRVSTTRINLSTQISRFTTVRLCAQSNRSRNLKTFNLFSITRVELNQILGLRKFKSCLVKIVSWLIHSIRLLNKIWGIVLSKGKGSCWSND